MERHPLESPHSFINQVREEESQPFFSQHWVRVLIYLILIFVVTAVIYVRSGIVVFRESLEGKDHLEVAINLLRQQDFKRAVPELEKAQDNLSRANRSFRKFLIFKYIPSIGPQIELGGNVLQLGDSLSSALFGLTTIADNIISAVHPAKITSFNSLTVDKKRLVLKEIDESLPILETVNEDISEADQALKAIPANALPESLQGSIIPLRQQLPLAKSAMSAALPIAKVFPWIAGYPTERTFLFLFQNNFELRPSGGFVGTYGVLKVQDAEVKSLLTDNVYRLDTPAANKGLVQIPAPDPVKKYLRVDDLYMRDANWSPDFPTSAEAVESLYHQEGGAVPAFDGVVAITPTYVSALLEMLGPIQADGTLFNAENIFDALEYHVEIGYFDLGLPTVERKAVVGTLTSKVVDRILNLPTGELLKILNITQKALAQKHILLTMDDADAQEIISDKKWTGAVKQSDKEEDYLMMVDANLAALKTDQVMERHIDYQISMDTGQAQARATVTYKNTGTFTWKTTRYRTYSRLYVPKGSRLIRAEGMMDNDRSSVPGQVDVTEELDKTVFGAFTAIEPGEERSLTFVYALPESINKQIRKGKYKLHVQKQSGTLDHRLTLDLNFGKKIKSASPVEEFDQFGDTAYKIDSNLVIDRDFKVNF